MIEQLLDAENALLVGMLERAEQTYRRVLDADPRNGIAAVGLARVALERGDEAGALALARAALEVDPENAMAGRMVQRLEEVARHRGAAAAAQPAAPGEMAARGEVAAQPAAPGEMSPGAPVTTDSLQGDRQSMIRDSGAPAGGAGIPAPPLPPAAVPAAAAPEAVVARETTGGASQAAVAHAAEPEVGRVPPPGGVSAAAEHETWTLSHGPGMGEGPTTDGAQPRRPGPPRRRGILHRLFGRS